LFLGIGSFGPGFGSFVFGTFIYWSFGSFGLGFGLLGPLSVSWYWFLWLLAPLSIGLLVPLSFGSFSLLFLFIDSYLTWFFVCS